MSVKFEMINNFYHTIKSDGTRLWNEKQVKEAVVKGWITAEEFETIVGTKYVK